MSTVVGNDERWWSATIIMIAAASGLQLSLAQCALCCRRVEIHLAAGAMAALIGLPGLPAITSPNDLDRITEGNWDPTMIRPTAFHPMGTCRMGRKGSSVVDSWGEHHDVKGLWVADGSIFPTCVAVNPQISIMAFATRTAERIAAKN